MKSIKKVSVHLLALCVTMLTMEGCTDRAVGVGDATDGADRQGEATDGAVGVGETTDGTDREGQATDPEPRWNALELTISQYKATVDTPISYSAQLIGDDGLQMDVEATLSSDIEPQLSYTSDSLAPKKSGTHTITATTSVDGEIFTDDVELEMLGGEPAEIKLSLSTQNPRLNQRVIAKAVIRDEFGNKLKTGWSLAIISEQPSETGTVKIVGHQLRFSAEGLFTVEAIAHENGISDTVGPIVVDSLAPGITIDNPPRFSMTEASFSTITGSAIDNISQIASVAINGEQLELQDEMGENREVSFATDVDFDFGTNLIKTVAIDELGRKGTDYRTIISGAHIPKGQECSTGIQTRISSNSRTIKSIERFSENTADDLNVSQIMEQSNPLVDIDKEVCLWLVGCHTARALRIDVRNLRKDATDIRLQTRNDGKIRATSRINNIVVDWNAHAIAFPLQFDFSGEIKADSITVKADIKPKVHDGRIEVETSHVEVSSSGFDLDWSGIMKVVDFFDFDILDNLVRKTVENSLRATVLDTVPAALEDSLQDLTVTDNLDINGKQYNLEARPEALTVDDAGITLSLKTFFKPAKWLNTSDLLPGSLYGGYTIPRRENTSKGFSISLSIDYISQMLYGLWGGGLFDQEIDASTLKINTSLLSGIIPGIGKLQTIVIKSKMPPVALPSGDDDSLLDIQLGDVEVALYSGDPSDPENLILRFYYGLESAVDMTMSNNMTLRLQTKETTFWFDVADPILPNNFEAKTETLFLSISGILEKAIQQAITEIPLPEMTGLMMESPEIGMTGDQGGYINVSGDLADL